MHYLRLIVITSLLVSCQGKSKYVLDEKSEMAQLMLYMHSELDSVKTKIKSKQNIGHYPKAFNAILDAPMTDESMRQENGFTMYAKALIEAEKTLYSVPQEKQKEAYKHVINRCLACHSSVGCSGPIPKIKKLSWSHN